VSFLKANPMIAIFLLVTVLNRDETIFVAKDYLCSKPSSLVFI